MKAQKKLSIVLILLIIILISIISFVGIFYQDKNQMENRIPDYSLGTDLEGYRKILLVVDEEDEGNTEDVLTYDNFVKSANVIKARLKSMGVEDYTVRCDESTGQIEITIPENTQTDYILADITQKGNFEIRNTSNDEVLMNNDDIRSVDDQAIQSTYNTSSSSIYMNINFNNAGSRKFRDITRDYQNTVTNDTAEENIVGETNSTYNETATNETTENSEEAMKYFSDKDIKIESVYEKDRNEYIAKMKPQIIATIAVSGVILLISLLEIFLLIRSSFLSRKKEVGILRAIGVKKTDIYKMFLGEILSISIFISLPGILIMSFIVNKLAATSFFLDKLVMNSLVIIISIVIVFVFNILIGLLPVHHTLRKRPAQILTENSVD